MRRLTLLLLALSFAVAAPAAHAQAPADRDGDGTPDSADLCADAPGGFNGCPSPPDRDGDGYPDSSDNCPDTPGPQSGCQPVSDRDGDGLPDASDNCPDQRGGFQGCPPPSDRDQDAIPDASDLCPDEPNGNVLMKGCPQASVDRDNDEVWDTVDACPDTHGDQADGCQAFVWKYFFSTANLKTFAADKPNDTTWCAGLVKCKRMHATFTLSAASAKATGIRKRQIGSISVAVPSFRFTRGISRATAKKLMRVKKITVTIHAWVILENGKKIEAPKKALTISKTRYAMKQFNSLGNKVEGPEEL